MSDPRRYRDSEEHPVLRAALQAGGDDRAPEGTQEKMLAALGLGTVVAVVGSASAGAGASAAGAGAGAGAAGAGGAAMGAKLVAGSVIVKWGLVLALAGGGAAAWAVAGDAPKGATKAAAPAPVIAASHAIETAPAPALAPPSSAEEASAAPRNIEPAAQPPVEPAPLAVAPPGALSGTEAFAKAAPARGLPVAPPRVAEPTSATSATSGSATEGQPPAPRGSVLAEERALLSEANAAVRNHDAGAANRILDQYEARFAYGSLAVEAEALRVEAAVLVDPARARTLARAFVERHPSSPVAPRMRRVADGLRTE